MQTILKRSSFIAHEFYVTETEFLLLFVVAFKRGSVSKGEAEMRVVEILDRYLNLRQ